MLVYVVRYPNGGHALQTTPSGHAVHVGDEVIPHWVVDKIGLNEQLIDGQAVQFEVWVRPVKEDRFGVA